MSPLLRQKLDPDDIVQEVALSCIHAFRDVDLSRGDPFDWVSEMIKRRVIDAGRHFTARKSATPNERSRCRPRQNLRAD